MPYEIPQQLQYEEKIVFGLTFKQLIYAIIFGIPAIIIFMRTHLPISIKTIAGVILIGMACMFMFFNFSLYIRNIMSWLKFREVSIMQPKMIQFIGVEKIQNGEVYVNTAKKLL